MRVRAVSRTRYSDRSVASMNELSAPRMLRAGKMPPIFPHKIPGVRHVKRIIKWFDRNQTERGH